MLIFRRRQEHVGSFHWISCNIFHFGKHASEEIVLIDSTIFFFFRGAAPIIRIEIFLEIRVRNFIPLFIFPVIRPILLDGIVCEMCVQVFTVFDVILAWSGSEIPFTVPVTFEFPIHTGHEHKMSDVKLSPVIQQRSFDIFLNNIRMKLIWLRLFLRF